ncbi:hypothetical protein SAMN05443245_1094 [Paraburkholderia fungorum]|uniref:Uncharacterized protein n=1 Tax=Paraburkholderia fungorum TaxID=134537 RepID=A0A1H1A9T1_9BURK|nr:hypothetical protein [Paraburkholderia fungorum]SDQ36412.1 hypothetical protein SAMN05443245_1094 [Paraburkholderia fungorum]
MDKENNQNVANGSFETNKTHDLTSAILDAAISDYEAIATTFAANAISDNSVRQQYTRHIRAISNQVRQEVESGHMTVKEGAEYCSQLRDKLFVEYRKYTSAVGVAKAEVIKLKSRGFDYYLDKYAQSLYGKNFSQLTDEQRAAVYYTTLSKAGGGNTEVTAKVRKLQVQARVAILFTAILATGEIVGAKDRVREAARQGSIIAGGMIGGTVASLAASFVCGPAEPICAAAVVLIGSNIGGMVGESVNDAYQEEIPVFIDWIRN